MNVSVLGIYGGVNMNPQMEAVRDKLDILVAILDACTTLSSAVL